MNFESYNPENFYDEFFEKSGLPRAEVKKLILGHYSSRYKDISLFKKEAEEIFRNVILAETGKIISI